jgi:predicted nuclease of predicted toxin-antitoxin system
MRFLVDECTGPAVARWLQAQGHEVFSVYDQSRGAQDDWIIRKAFEEGWVLVTNDKDFGEKVYRERYPHKGVVLLRLEDERSANKIATMQRLIDNHGGLLSERYVVVTERQVRFARS